MQQSGTFLGKKKILEGKKKKRKKVFLFQSWLESWELFSHELLLCTLGIKAKMKAVFILSKACREGPICQTQHNLVSC